MEGYLGGIGLLQIPIFLGMAASAAFYLIQVWSAAQFFRPRPVAEPAFQPPVTVLKPLKGVDVQLYENLRSFCVQRYPAYQIICGVADPKDPAVEVVRRLQAELPQLDLELVVDGHVYGTNYKVSNLHNMYQRARHAIIVLADSDIRVSPDYLTRVVAPLADRRVGVATCLYRAISTGGLPTLVEELFVNTDFANLVMLARKVEKASYAFGATIAMRREVLEEIGGFLPIANLLADDYEIGYRVFQRGYVNELTTEVVDTVLSVGTWRRLYDHQLRWARTYRVNRPGGYFGSVLTHGTFWAVLNLIYNGFTQLSWLLSGAVIGLRYLAAGRMAWTHLKTDMTWQQFLLVGPKDLFLTAVWFAAFGGNRVVWSGREFEVHPGGDMVDVSGLPPPAPAPAAEADDPAEPVARRA